MTPVISVIIPAYNVEEYITECLESVACQTSEISVECIIVDDKSTDGTPLRINEFVDNYRGHVEFTVLAHDKNQGQGIARNTALDVARGEYVFFLDADDVLTDDSLLKLMKCAQLHPGVDLVSGLIICQPRDLKREELFDCSEFRDTEYIDSEEEIKKRYRHMPWHITATLWRRAVIESHHLRFETGFKFEDYLFRLKSYYEVKSMSFCFEPVYIYRTRLGSTSYGVSKQELAGSRLSVYKALAKHHYPYDKYMVKEIIRELGCLCVEIKNLGLGADYRQRYLEIVETMSQQVPRRCRPVFSYLKVPRPFMRGIILKPLTKILV